MRRKGRLCTSREGGNHCEEEGQALHQQGLNHCEKEATLHRSRLLYTPETYTVLYFMGWS